MSQLATDTTKSDAVTTRQERKIIPLGSAIKLASPNQSEFIHKLKQSQAECDRQFKPFSESKAGQLYKEFKSHLKTLRNLDLDLMSPEQREEVVNTIRDQWKSERNSNFDETSQSFTPGFLYDLTIEEDKIILSDELDLNMVKALTPRTSLEEIRNLAELVGLVVIPASFLYQDTVKKIDKFADETIDAIQDPELNPESENAKHYVLVPYSSFDKSAVVRFIVEESASSIESLMHEIYIPSTLSQRWAGFMESIDMYSALQQQQNSLREDVANIHEMLAKLTEYLEHSANFSVSLSNAVGQILRTTNSLSDHVHYLQYDRRSRHNLDIQTNHFSSEGIRLKSQSVPSPKQLKSEVIAGGIAFESSSGGIFFSSTEGNLSEASEVYVPLSWGEQLQGETKQVVSLLTKKSGEEVLLDSKERWNEILM